MTLKDKLPDRLKCSPLLTMESDSDIETIAESIVNLSDSDGDFFKFQSTLSVRRATVQLDIFVHFLRRKPAAWL